MKKILLSVSTLAFVAVVVSQATGAFFTDTETSNASTFTAGTLEIAANGNGSSGTFNISPLNVGGLAPGDVTPEMTITVKNRGSINAAVFGKFTLGTGTLADELSFYSYKVDYFNADGTPTDRWTTDDNYYGVGTNEDWFIKDGEAHPNFIAAGGSNSLASWLTGNGALDEPGQPDDMEGLKPDEYYTITFQLKMDEDANNSYQGASAQIGYVINAYQINQAALDAIGMGGHYTYLNGQVND